MDGATPLKDARRERFCQEYLVDLIGAAAAKRAGYSPKTAASQAARLLTDANVAARIAFLKAERAERTGITIDTVVLELAKVGLASLRQMIRIDRDGQPQIDLSATPADALDALSEVSTETVIETQGSGEDRVDHPIRKTRIKMHDKLRALHLLGEHVGAFKKGKEDQAQATATAFADMVAQLLRGYPAASKMPINRGPKPPGGAA
jgi:phage terminase small subunit